jgi:hypothetical protein
VAALKWLVGVMGVLIVAGTVALAVLIVQRLGEGEAGGLGARHLGQPPGTRIVSVASDQGRLAVLVARPDGERVLLVDPRRGRVLGELRAAE